ncbi:MAG: thioredoxin family protein [Clostridium sp.]|uniref:thioredoxin family protein n=1 Tax=Clostridium sp. TaxID=1506 RepID=UPI002FC9FD89
MNIDINKKSSLLTDELRSQLKDVLSRIESKVTLATVIDGENEKSTELLDLAIDIASLSDKLEVIAYEKGEDTGFEEKIHADKFPVLSLLNSNGDYSGVKFHGVPGGHELNSFILAIYNLAGPSQNLNPATIESIKAIDKNLNIKVCISQSCHLCPDVVVATQRIAIENPNIETEMVDVMDFKDIRKKFKIMSVPAIIINDEVVKFGSKSIEEIIDLIK